MKNFGIKWKDELLIVRKIILNPRLSEEYKNKLGDQLTTKVK